MSFDDTISDDESCDGDGRQAADPEEDLDCGNALRGSSRGAPSAAVVASTAPPTLARSAGVTTGAAGLVAAVGGDAGVGPDIDLIAPRIAGATVLNREDQNLAVRVGIDP